MPDEPALTVPQRQHAPKGPIKVRADHISQTNRISEAKQCTAHAKHSGKKCKFAAIPGGTVCRFHGGGAPQVQFKAEERLRALQPPAVRKLGHWIDQDEFPTVSLGACKDVLDRTMGRAGEVVQINQTVTITVTERLLRGRQRLSE